MVWVSFWLAVVSVVGVVLVGVGVVMIEGVVVVVSLLLWCWLM